MIYVFNYGSWQWNLSMLNARIGSASSKRSSSARYMLAREFSNVTTSLGQFEDSSLIKMVGQGNSWQGGCQTSGRQSVRNSRRDSLSSLLWKSLMKLDKLIIIHIFIQDEAKVTVKDSLEWQVVLIFNLLNILANVEWLQHGKPISISTGSGFHFHIKDELLRGVLNSYFIINKLSQNLAS